MKISEASDRFIIHCKHTKKLSEHTLRAYQIDIDCFLAFSDRERGINECDRLLLRDYLHHLYENCNLKNSSAKRRFACLKAMFRWLESEEDINESPFRKLNLPIRLPARLPRGLNKREIRKLLTEPLKQLGETHRNNLTTNRCIQIAEQPKQFRHFISLITLDLLFATGIRVAELVSIRIEDIDLSEGTIRIHGKGDRERLVFLPGHSLCKLLGIYIQVRQKIAINNDYLIITSRGSKANTQYARLLVRDAGESARLTRRITPHMLRHSTATHLLNSGIDIRFVQRLLGHQSITTTQIYTQVSDTMLKQVLIKKHPMDNILGG